MRIAAGILMIIGAVLGITMLRAIYGFIPGVLGWLPWLWAFFCRWWRNLYAKEKSLAGMFDCKYSPPILLNSTIPRLVWRFWRGD